MRKAVCAVLLLAICPFLVAQQALNNDSIIKMVKAQLSDDVIVTTINASPGAYDTSPDGLIALKQAGVSNKVIDALVAKSTSAASAPTSIDSIAPSTPTHPHPRPRFRPCLQESTTSALITKTAAETSSRCPLKSSSSSPAGW